MSRDYQIIGPFFTGEVPLPLEVTFTDADGTVINLTGYDTEAKIDDVAGATVAPAGVASIPTPANGIVEYEWGAGDLDAAGWFTLQLWVGNGTTRIASLPYRYLVEDVTPAPTI